MEVPESVIYVAGGAMAAAIGALWLQVVASARRCHAEGAALVARIQQIETRELARTEGLLADAVHVLERHGIDRPGSDTPIANRIGRLAMLILCWLSIGCAHRETAQAVANAVPGIEAIEQAQTPEQRQAIAAWVRQVLAGVYAREIAGLTEPPVARLSAGDYLTATDPAAAAPVRDAAGAKVIDELTDNLAALSKASRIDQFIATAYDWLTGLVAKTTAAGALIAAGLKVLSMLRTARTTAQVAFDGMHQAQSALRQLSPEAAAAIDSASLHMQSRLPPAVRQLGDLLVSQAKKDAASVVPVSVPSPSMPAAVG